MSPKETRPPWSPSSAPGFPQARTRRPLLPSLGAEAAVEVQSADAMPSEASELTEAEYRVVGELRDRVSTRLTAEDKNYAAGPRRELTKKLIRDEYDQWLLHEANRGRAAPTVTTEDRIFAAVLAELDGLGRLAPLLARDDVEDIHFEGCDPTMLRTVEGQLVAGPPIASSDEELEQLLRSIGSRSDGGRPAGSSPRPAPSSMCD
jgi:pilus assembly protein CpaF